MKKYEQQLTYELQYYKHDHDINIVKYTEQEVSVRKKDEKSFDRYQAYPNENY